MVSSQASFQERSFFPETSRPDTARGESEKIVPRLLASRVQDVRHSPGVKLSCACGGFALFQEE
jgi:hypothetical protein